MRWRVIWASKVRLTPSMPKVKLACSMGLAWPTSLSMVRKRAVFSSSSPSRSSVMWASEYQSFAAAATTFSGSGVCAINRTVIIFSHSSVVIFTRGA